VCVCGNNSVGRWGDKQSLFLTVTALLFTPIKKNTHNPLSDSPTLNLNKTIKKNRDTEKGGENMFSLVVLLLVSFLFLSISSAQ
jgi:hypothetical protein